MKNYILKIMFALLFSVLLFSCNTSDDIASTQTQQKDKSQEDDIKSVPFFNVAKGDTIEKGIFREKPDFKEDVTVLFSSEDNVLFRNSGNSTGTGGGFIYDLKTSVRSSNDAPYTLAEGGRTYYKIGVDLNEGAGGPFIYLYYTKALASDNVGMGFTNLNIVAWCCGPCLAPPDAGYVSLGKSFGSGGWTDLNQGVGGWYLYIEGLRNGPNSPYIPSVITNILIISSTSSMSSYSGWNLIPTDLNKGAGGKYIYLCYQFVRI